MGAWCARHNNRLQWFQVFFGRPTRVVKIATQGRQDARQWVTQYYLSYSQDGIHYAEFEKNSNRKVWTSLLLASSMLSVSHNLIAFHEPFASCKGNIISKFERKSTKAIKNLMHPLNHKIKMVQRNLSFKLC